MSSYIAHMLSIEVRVCDITILRLPGAAPFFSGSPGIGTMHSELCRPPFWAVASYIADFVEICSIRSLNRAMRVSIPISSS